MPASGMPSRMRLVMAGDPRLAVVGRMSRQRRVLLSGDPFLGGLGGIIKKGLGGLFKHVVAPALGIATPIPPIGSLPLPESAPGKAAQKIISKITIPSPFSIGGQTTFGGPRRRRRMNPLNPRALRRALSRASAFSRFARRALHVTFGKAPRVRFKIGRRKKT